MDFSWPFKKKQVSAPVIKTIGVGGALEELLKFGQSGAETPMSAMRLYRESSAVSIPINKVAGAFASIRPVLEMPDHTIVTDHPLLDLLRNPSSFYSPMLFMETLAKHYLITNEASVVAIGGVNRPPLEIQPISPSNISVSEGTGGYAHTIGITGNTLAGSYNIKLGGDRARYFDGNLRELKHIRGFSTRNNSLLRGQSLLVSAAAEARQHILGNKHNVSLLEKGGRLSYVFHYEDTTGQNLIDFEETKQSVRKEVGGADNAGAIIISSGGNLKIDEMGVNNKDMDYVKLQAAAKNAVALQYNVPLPLINLDASTFNNYQAAILALYDDAALPLADSIFGGLGQLLLPRFGEDPTRVRLTYDILQITALRERVLGEIKTRKDIGIETDNELRKTMGRDEYMGGDQIYKPANMIPVGEEEADPPRVLRDDD